MLLIIALVIASLFIYFLKDKLKQYPNIFYIGAAVVTIVIFSLRTVAMPQFVRQNIVGIFAKGTIGTAFFIIVMITGALPRGSKLIGPLMRIRGELSIMAAILVLSHNLTYGMTYFKMLFSAPAALPAVQRCAAVISLMWVSIYNGNSPLSLSLVVIDTILAPFLIPAVLKLLVGSSVKMDTVGMMKELVFMIALPAVLAMCLNEVSHGKVMETWPKKLAPFSKMCLIFVVTSNSSKVSPYMKHLNGERLEVAAAILVLAAGGYAIGWIIAILTRQNKAATVSMIYGSGMRNISAGAGAYFPAETLFPVMIGTLFQQILAAFYGSMMRRIQTGQQEREKEHGVSA